MSSNKKIVIRVPTSSRTSGSINCITNRVRQTKVPNRVKELVNQFALEHLNDDRKMFKNAWNNWICTGEIQQLLSTHLHNSDELKDKLYFSARYYHRKKIANANPGSKDCPPWQSGPDPQPTDKNSTDERGVVKDCVFPEIGTPIISRASSIDSNISTETKKTRSYKKNDRSILESIDEHLATLPNGPNGFLTKPAIAYNMFISAANMQSIDAEHIKKTYKNRFYMKEKHIIAAAAAT